MTARAWCVTIQGDGFEPHSVINNWTTSWNTLSSKIRYLIAQHESGGETGRDHLQCYVELKQPARVRGVQRLLEVPTAHCEARQGTRDQARDYCRKPETRVAGPWEFGEWARQPGKRNDLDALWSALEANASNVELWQTPETRGPMLRYHRAVDRYRFDTAPRRSEPPRVVVLWGPPGTGKTRRVHDLAGDDLFMVDVPRDRSAAPWFDGYAGQRSVLMDDFKGEYAINYFKRLTDRYPMKVQVKGGYTHWTPTTIYITSNHSPDNWYPDADPVDIAALARRYTAVHHVTSNLYHPDHTVLLH